MTPSLQTRIPPPAVVLAVRCPPTVALLGLAAALLYAVSFFLPAADGVAGYNAFVFSLVFLFFVPMWAANPAFWSGLAHLYQGQYRSARNAGLAALLLSLSQSWMVYRELRVGYLAWVGSMALLAVAGWCGQLGRMSAQGPKSAGEATRIAARFAASRPALLPPEGQDAFQEVRGEVR
jgi:hypothetical protein